MSSDGSSRYGIIISCLRQRMEITMYSWQSRSNIIYINTSPNDFETTYEHIDMINVYPLFCNNMIKQCFNRQITNLTRLQGSHDKVKFKWGSSGLVVIIFQLCILVLEFYFFHLNGKSISIFHFLTNIYFLNWCKFHSLYKTTSLKNLTDLQLVKEYYYFSLKNMVIMWNTFI